MMNHDGGYLEIKYKGQISDSEVLSAYESYFDSDDAIPASNNLTDLSEADLSNLSFIIPGISDPSRTLWL